MQALIQLPVGDNVEILCIGADLLERSLLGGLMCARLFDEAARAVLIAGSHLRTVDTVMAKSNPTLPGAFHEP